MLEVANFYNFTGTEFSSAIVIFNVLLTFALQMAVVWVYKKTHRGISYSQSFLFTLVMIGVLGAVIMMVVQNNLIGAFALLGAFSLIRFRTIVKDTRDVAFVFFALARAPMLLSMTSNLNSRMRQFVVLEEGLGRPTFNRLHSTSRMSLSCVRLSQHLHVSMKEST